MAHAGGRTRLTAQRRGATLVALACLVAFVTAAQAQTDPYATTEQVAKDTGADTDFTPVAKESDRWELFHGAQYPRTEVVKGSVTSFDSDLFAVAFEDPRLGLAGGSACPTPPLRGSGEGDQDFGRRVSECRDLDGTPHQRVPALYRYLEPENADPSWDRIPLPNHDQSGYIGAIAWIDNFRGPDTEALIVGGTGTYPRREKGIDDSPPAAPGRPDQAGKARAWIYDANTDSARELDLSALTADEPSRAGMRGLSAVGCHVDPIPTPPAGEEPAPEVPSAELCFAGGLGQIWQVRAGEFTGERVDAQSPAAELVNASALRFRVRYISASGGSAPSFVAATAGCCVSEQTANTPTVLSYDGAASEPRWLAAARPYSATDPDSIYSIFPGKFGGSAFLRSPGGPEKPGEPPSRHHDDKYGLTISTPELNTARLVSAAREWAVGELRSTRREGLGARGLGVWLQTKDFACNNLCLGLLGFINAGASTNGGVRPTPQEVVAGWHPIRQDRFDDYVKSRHYFLPSYSANAVETRGGNSWEGISDGWAVGDHGAILRVKKSGSGPGGAVDEPKPPHLGRPRPEPFSASDAYDATRPPLPSSAGPVPALGGETLELGEPRMSPVNPVSAQRIGIRQVVMSRDGSEGWAFGNAGVNALYRYDGVRWSRCRPTASESTGPADPACAALAPIEGYEVGTQKLTLDLIDAQRVPVENDSDPTNDDEFEVLALTNSYSGPETNGKGFMYMFVRYSDGRWRFEPPAESQEKISGPIEIAYAADDDGWIIGSPGTAKPASLFHFDGGRWYDCHEDPADCGDRDGRLLQLGIGGNTARQMVGIVAAGDRVYLYGSRALGEATPGSALTTAHYAPQILYHDRGGIWTDGSGRGEDDAGFDPGFEDPATLHAGSVESLSVVELPGGGFEGWAVGEFGGVENPGRLAARHLFQPDAALMRLGAGEGWRTFRSPGPIEDYLLPRHGQGRPPTSSDHLQVGYPSTLDPDAAFIGQDSPGGGTAGGRLFGFNAARQRFELLDSARPQGNPVIQLLGEAVPAGNLSAMAPDGRGGFWAAVDSYFFHWSDRVREEVFQEVANPLGARNVELRDIDAGPDGSIWVASNTNRVYRYDRRLGWEEATVAGWDPGRLTTRASQASAIAVGSDGEGLVVGEGGRIAEISPAAVGLDPAAGRSCAHGDAIPCGSSRNLAGVDIAPGGSALAVGERLTVLWRPAGEEFRRVSGPEIPSSTGLVAISHPAPDTAYLLSSSAAIYRGSPAAGGDWRWALERPGGGPPVRALALDGAGHGYAVGERGLVLERRGEGAWETVRVPTDANLTSVDLAEPGGDGALIGGERGLILTGRGSEFEIAREPDFASGGHLLGFAYLPGAVEGSVDAWAAMAPAPNAHGGRGDDRLLRYSSAGSEAALDPQSRLAALPDAPAHEPGELAIGAFGKSDCERAETELCPEMTATTTTNELISGRIVDELAAREERGELDVALQSGDAVDSAGLPGSSLGDYDKIGNAVGLLPAIRAAGQLKHRRWEEQVASELPDEGVPLFGTIGSQDLSETYACAPFESHCETTKQIANAGENYAWREALAGSAEPWGLGAEAVEVESELSFEPTPGQTTKAVRVDDQRADLDGEGTLPEAKAEIGGANTHYAVDAIRDGEPIARIVVVDTSLRSLAASDPIQQPVEAGGQARWLEEVLCFDGSPEDTNDDIRDCTRERDQRAIVVSNTPTYSYGPGAITHTATDATTFEATMLRHDVDLVVSGALGYNGLYYTLAPGIHSPCPGGEHPKAPPEGLPECAGNASEATEALDENGVPDPTKALEEQRLAGAYPTLIASGAGGKFGPDGNRPADGPAGQWHGYSVARLMPGGEVRVEQRPILDWIGLDAAEHALEPNEKLALSGYGRSPISTVTEGGWPHTFHYEISSAAITHRYELLLADPEEPWLPCEADDPGCEALHAKLSLSSRAEASRSDAVAEGSRPDDTCEPYLCLPERVATIDDQSGQVKAGNGKYPNTFAIAMLSVDEKVATWPLYFKRSPSFVVNPAAALPAIPTVPAGTGSAPPPPQPPNPPQPDVPQASLPQSPALPGVPPLSAAAPPEPQPPAPPAPPPPAEQPSPLSLTLAPPGIAIATPTAVIQPPTPPVNPAPPGGARREARQRQAAAQKSGADNEEGGSNVSDAGGDMAQGSDSLHGTSSMVRRDRSRAEPSFTPIARADQPSAWAQGLLYTGGATLLAATLALGWSGVRPTPRRRSPQAPAPAYAWIRSRR